jgi:hypothetical protein
MSDGHRFFDDESVRRQCIEYVETAGGQAFFLRPKWRKELLSLITKPAGHFETTSEREKAIYEELYKARTILNERLGANTVRHVCFPWGVAGKVALRAAKKIGYDTAFSDRLFGRRAVKAGDHPYKLMRLPNRYIFSLPGRGRRTVFFTRLTATDSSSDVSVG